MRLPTVLPILALVLSAAPLASAEAASGLVIDAPAQGYLNAPVPLNLTLTITNFACAADFDVTLALDASAQNGSALAPTLDKTNVTLTIPAGSYLIGAWSGTANATLTTTTDAANASGDVTVHALFAPTDEGPCVTSGSGGFAPAEATATIHVAAAPPQPPASSEPTTPPAPSVNDTQSPTPASPTNGTTNQTAPPPSNGTTNGTTTSGPANGTSNGTVDQLPPGGGYIGDYHPTESRGVPAPALWGTLVAVGIAALAASRRFRR